MIGTNGMLSMMRMETSRRKRRDHLNGKSGLVLYPPTTCDYLRKNTTPGHFRNCPVIASNTLTMIHRVHQITNTPSLSRTCWVIMKRSFPIKSKLFTPINTNLMWNKSCRFLRRRAGAGEYGEAVELDKSLDKPVKDSIAEFGFNIVASDRISLDRAPKDLRHPQ